MRDISTQSTKPSPETCGGIVLCGGRSQRMGQSKAWLPFGNETCLQRVVRILSEQLSPIVVVAAPDQQLPPLPPETLIVHDPREGLGPLAGIALGLQALSNDVDAAYVTGCDTPLLKPTVVSHIISKLEAADAAIVRDGTFYHPLAAVYRTSLAASAWALVEQQQLRLLRLIEEIHHIDISVEDLRHVDPQLCSLENMNTPADYNRLLALLN